MRLVKKLHCCAQLLSTTDNTKKAEDMLAEIQRLLHETGLPVRKPQQTKGKTPIGYSELN
jgi:hypothetical protein